MHVLCINEISDCFSTELAHVKLAEEFRQSIVYLVCIQNERKILSKVATYTKEQHFGTLLIFHRMGEKQGKKKNFG